MEVYNEKKETLARFIERTLLGWPENLRVYHIDAHTYSCYETDKQWEQHLIEIDKTL